MTPELERVFKARAGLICKSPFYGVLAWRLEPKIDPETKGSFWVDGKRVGIHPQAAAELPIEELEGVLAQATLNAALGHPLRRDGRDPQDWSRACAEVAKHEVIASGQRLPSGSEPDPQFKGMTAEQAYKVLHVEPEPPQDGGGKGQPSPEEGQEAGGGGGSSPEEGKEGKGKGKNSPQSPAGQSGKGEAQPEGAKSQEGPSSQAGEASPEESDPLSGGSEVRDSGGDEAEVAAEAEEWREAAAQASQLARVAGALPGGLERLALSIINPRVDWREALARFFKSKARDDQSWMVPNRRFIGSGMYLPGMQSTRAGLLAIAIDLSGSIKQREVDAFLSEVESARTECRPERVVLLPFDTRVSEVIEVAEDEPLEFKAVGGGGTHFGAPIAKLAELGIEPEALVYLTDLMGPFGDEPDYPVVWVTTRAGQAPYGEVIEMI